MAKKTFKGYSGKISSAVKTGLITVSAVGVVTAFVWGGSVISKLNARPELKDDNETTIGQVGNMPSLEPDINQDQTNNEDITTTLPGLEDITLPSDDPIIEDLGVEFVEVLAKLTQKSKDYIQGVSGSTSAPNVTIMGITNIQTNSSNGDVVLFGQIDVNGKLSNFTANINNANTSLNIYGLGNDVTEGTLVDALDELLSDEQTSFKLQLKQYINLSNASDVIQDILDNRLDALNAMGSTDQSIIDEIAHINSLNYKDLQLNVLLNNRTVGENGYIYSFNISVNTGKYVYSANLAFESKYSLGASAIKQNIEQYLDTNFEYPVDATTSNAVNKALYLINGEIFNLEDENTLNQ